MIICKECRGFRKLAASPTKPQIAIAAFEADSTIELVILDGETKMVYGVLELIRTDIVAGFSSTGDAAALVTDGERFDSELVLVPIDAESAVAPVELDASATPLTWSRTTLTLQSLRVDPEA